MEPNVSAPAISPATAATVRALSATRGTTPVLRGVDLDVGTGEICALMGVSGAGKSTVLRAIAALQAFSAGSIVVDGFALQPGPVPPESKLRPLRRKAGRLIGAGFCCTPAPPTRAQDANTDGREAPPGPQN